MAAVNQTRALGADASTPSRVRRSTRATKYKQIYMKDLFGGIHGPVNPETHTGWI